MQALMDNIVRLESCASNVKTLFVSQDMSYVFKVCRPNKYAHGLLGQNYNHARSKGRKKFRQFVIVLCQPTGRTIQKDGDHMVLFIIGTQLLPVLGRRRKMEGNRALSW